MEPLNPAWSWLQSCQSSAGQCNETEQLRSQDMYESHFLSVLHIFFMDYKTDNWIIEKKNDEICLFWMGTYLTNIAPTHTLSYFYPDFKK